MSEINCIRETVTQLGKTLTEELIKAQDKINKKQDKIQSTLTLNIQTVEQRAHDRCQELEQLMTQDLRHKIEDMQK